MSQHIANYTLLPSAHLLSYGKLKQYNQYSTSLYMQQSSIFAIFVQNKHIFLINTTISSLWTISTTFPAYLYITSWPTAKVKGEKEEFCWIIQTIYLSRVVFSEFFQMPPFYYIRLRGCNTCALDYLAPNYWKANTVQ